MVWYFIAACFTKVVDGFIEVFYPDFSRMCFFWLVFEKKHV